MWWSTMKRITNGSFASKMSCLYTLSDAKDMGGGGGWFSSRAAAAAR